MSRPIHRNKYRVTEGSTFTWCQELVSAIDATDFWIRVDCVNCLEHAEKEMGMQLSIILHKLAKIKGEKHNG